MDPMDKEQTKVYFSNYRDPLQKFKGAYMALIARSYDEVIDQFRHGANKAINCEGIYQRIPFICEQLVTRENHEVIELVKITLIIIDPYIST